MKRVIYYLIFLIILSNIAYSYSAMGVSPASYNLVYAGQGEIQGKFVVLTDGKKNLRIKSALGLSENMIFENGEDEIELFGVENPEIFYTLKIPEDIAPGLHHTEIIVSQFFTAEEKVEYANFAVAQAAMAFVIELRVPNDGKFLEADISIEPDKIEIGDDVFITISLLNFGTEDITNLQSDIIISDSTGDEIYSTPTTRIDLIQPAQLGQLRAFWNTKDQSSGDYHAESSIDYGGNFPTIVKSGFRIGEILIKIIDVRYDFSSEIGKFYVDVASNWNEPIPEVYAEFVIKKNDQLIETVKSSSVELSAWGEATLEAFWEKGSTLPGQYEMEVLVYYYDQITQQFIKVSLEEIEKKAPDKDYLVLILVVFLALMVLINSVWLFISLRKKEINKKSEKPSKSTKKNK